MRVIVRCFIGIMLCWVTTLAQAQTLLVMGDSLSAAYGIPVQSGWVSLLEKRLQQNNANWQVVNASISGETTSGGLTRFKPLLESHKPALVIIELGANDGLRGLPLEDMKRNLNTMIEQAKGSGANVLLLGMKLPPNYGVKFTARFEKVYTDLVAEQSVAFLPFFLDGVAGHPELTQADGLHPVAAAQPQILENIWPLLDKTMAKVKSSSIPAKP